MVDWKAVCCHLVLSCLLPVKKLLIASWTHVEHSVSLVVRVLRNGVVYLGFSYIMELQTFGSRFGHRVNPHEDAALTETVTAGYQDARFVLLIVEVREAVRAVHCLPPLVLLNCNYKL